MGRLMIAALILVSAFVVSAKYGGIHDGNGNKGHAGQEGHLAGHAAGQGPWRTGSNGGPGQHVGMGGDPHRPPGHGTGYSVVHGSGGHTGGHSPVHGQEHGGFGGQHGLDSGHQAPGHGPGGHQAPGHGPGGHQAPGHGPGGHQAPGHGPGGHQAPGHGPGGHGGQGAGHHGY